MPTVDAEGLERIAAMMTEGRKRFFAARGRLAQLVRAPALQAGCRGFESLTAHQKHIL